MGQRLKDNFNKRFGNRINILYSDKLFNPSEQRIHNEKIYKAFSEVLNSVLGREPTEAELFGIVDIRKSVKRR